MSDHRFVRLIVLIVCILSLTSCASLWAPLHPIVPPVWPDGPAPPRFHENLAASYRIATGSLSGTGSSAAISANGCLVTVGHVADAEASVIIGYNAIGDRLDMTAQSVLSEPIDDISIVRLDGTKLAPVELGSTSDLPFGEPVYAIGYPHSASGQPSVRDGSIFAIGYNVGRNTSGYILLDVTIAELDSEPGMSGAGIFRQVDGKLIGILRGSIEIQGTWYAFATPVEHIKTMLVRAGCQ